MSDELHRTLSSRQVSMIGLGGAIGTGLFLGSGLAIGHAGPATVVAYVLCALVALVIAWALAEMAVVHPTAGSFGAIAGRYLGDWAGFVTRWTYWTIQVIAIGGEVIAAGIYFQFWWPQVPLWVSVVVFSAVILAINAAAVRFFGEFEYWFAIIKVTAIVVFILVGAAYIFLGLPEHPPVGTSNLTEHGGFLPNGLEGLGVALVFVIFSYIGTEVVAVTAAESADPQRDIPRAARSMVVRLALFYCLAIAVVVAIVPWTHTASGNDVTASPFVLLFDFAGVPAAAGIMNFVVLTAALSSANTNIYLTTRMLHSLSRDRQAPAWLGTLSRSGVPRRAIAVSAIGLAVAALLSVRQENTAYVVLFGVSVFGALVVWLLILATHVAFRWQRAGQPPGPARLWGAPVTTGLAGVVLFGILVSTAFIPDLSGAWKAGGCFFALLLMAYAAVRYRRSRRGPDTAGPDSRPATEEA